MSGENREMVKERLTVKNRMEHTGSGWIALEPSGLRPR